MLLKLRYYKFLVLFLIIILFANWSYVYLDPVRVEKWQTDPVVTKSIFETVELLNKSLSDIYQYNVVPFEVVNNHSIEIRFLDNNPNTIQLSSTSEVLPEITIEYSVPVFLRSDRVKSPPNLFLNGKSMNLAVMAAVDCGFNCKLGFKKQENIRAYALNEPLLFPANEQTLFVIKSAILRREITNTTEIRVPLLFKRDEYTKRINIPQIVPFFIPENKTTGIVRTEVYLPDFYRINAKDSGWVNLKSYNFVNDIYINNKYMTSFVTGPFSVFRQGTINQTVLFENEFDRIMGTGKVTFETYLSEQNPPFNFEITLLPTTSLFFIILVVLLTPIFYPLIKHRRFKKRGFKEVLLCYAIIIGFYGLNSLEFFTSSDIFILFSRLKLHLGLWKVILLFSFPMMDFGIEQLFKRNGN